MPQFDALSKLKYDVFTIGHWKRDPNVRRLLQQFKQGIPQQLGQLLQGEEQMDRNAARRRKLAKKREAKCRPMPVPKPISMSELILHRSFKMFPQAKVFYDLLIQNRQTLLPPKTDQTGGLDSLAITKKVLDDYRQAAYGMFQETKDNVTKVNARNKKNNKRAEEFYQFGLQTGNTLNRSEVKKQILAVTKVWFYSLR